ncbi:Uncharacterised protein [Mycobacteroides abscessus subsp. abscessus]|nr:Uncharacterised protein [Mycobacteroides abscessus subsp. abscessus]SHW34384.1 Uncharacterised protein [Mycobacteroides abscessus subsp. abscessus]SIE68318.1 Uncharacterised protein [Mycobacteroides abscessus subsp. abscessus]SIF90066.1 Uncharacterised protein [Mycobacteroides abscessus subsp. abscessus]SKD17708.1 Uncharacterised protein [Mycobacteroides abscessus subsp. abscessus]
MSFHRTSRPTDGLQFCIPFDVFGALGGIGPVLRPIEFDTDRRNSQRVTCPAASASRTRNGPSMRAA